MLEGKDRIDHYLSLFESARGHLPGAGSWLDERRREASDAFARLGFPGRGDEAWRYTSVEPLARRPFRPMVPRSNGVDAGSLDGLTFGTAAAARLAFVNGVHRPDLSSTGGLPPGLTVRPLSGAAAEGMATLPANLGRHAAAGDHPFVALNAALWRDGAYVEVPAGTVLEAPLHLLFLVHEPGESAMAQVRNLIVVGERAQVTIVETYAGPDGEAYWTGPVTELVQAAGSIVDHCKVQREGRSSFHLGTLGARLERDAALRAHSVSLGGGLMRNDVNALLAAPGADCTLNGLYVLDGTRHEDNHTLIDHAEPHGTSRELYKGILDGRSRAVFNGGIVVRPDAQKTDSRQTNNNLLLSDDALVDTKPQLEIYADDVKCAHGATVGQLDEAGLFYLRSRGLNRETARSLMIYAFAAEVLDRIRMEALRDGLKAELAARLPNLDLSREDL